jgi:hypothetical protein
MTLTPSMPCFVGQFSAVTTAYMQHQVQAGPLPHFALHTIPYVVRVVCTTGGRSSCGSGTVMQYRCGVVPLFVSDEWYLLTNAHVVRHPDADPYSRRPVLADSGYVEFFYETAATPVRVDIAMREEDLRVFSPEFPYTQAPRSLDTLDLAICRCSGWCFFFPRCYALLQVAFRHRGDAVLCCTVLCFLFPDLIRPLRFGAA